MTQIKNIVVDNRDEHNKEMNEMFNNSLNQDNGFAFGMIYTTTKGKAKISLWDNAPRKDTAQILRNMADALDKL